MRRVIEHDIGGAYNLAGPRLTWRQFMGLLGVAAPVWVPATVLQAATWPLVNCRCTATPTTRWPR